MRVCECGARAEYTVWRADRLVRLCDECEQEATRTRRPQPRRPLPPRPERCPHCGATWLALDVDGWACWCGWHSWERARTGLPRAEQTPWQYGRAGWHDDSPGELDDLARAVGDNNREGR